MNEWNWYDYVIEDHYFVDFAPGMLVLDVGCGNGTQLQQLGERGCVAIGIDVDWASLMNCRRQGLKVLQAYGEQIPVKNRSLEGLVCKVVIPLTREARVLGEIGRVLKV